MLDVQVLRTIIHFFAYHKVFTSESAFFFGGWVRGCKGHSTFSLPIGKLKIELKGMKQFC